MGKTREHRRHRHDATDGDPPLPLHAYPPSPSSTSSSDFEFTVSLSPRKAGGSSLCPADELFYRGQLLPLHLSPRISMVRSLILASSSTSSCSDTTASRDSSGSSNDSTVSAFSAADVLAFAAAAECDSSRPSSVTEEDAARVAVQRLHPRHKYFSSLATRFSSVFHRKSRDAQQQENAAVPAPAPPEIGSANDGEAAVSQVQISSSTSGRRSTAKSGASASSAKEVFKKYVKKVKPLYEKLEKLSTLQHHRNHHQQQSQKSQTAARQELRKKTFSFSVRRGDRSALDRVMMSASASRKEREVEEEEEERHGRGPIYAHSFSGNLRFLQRRQCAAAAAAMSCPSSMRSSPSHSGLLYPRERGYGSGGGATSSIVDPVPAAAVRTCRFHPSSWSSSSSMEELQSAIQGAIAHCKSTMSTQSSSGKASASASEQI